MLTCGIQNFIPGLKDHLLSRLSGKDYNGDEQEYSDEERRALLFVDNRIYRHKVVRVNYTTYDLRRDQDSLNPRTHADVMVTAHEDQAGRDSHPYWYARIVGVFHADVQHVGPTSKSTESQRVDFLWVRWFGRDMHVRAGFPARRLHRIGFVSDDEDTNSPSFGFLDPAQVIRGVHLIPAFEYGKTLELLGPSIVRPSSDDDEDWVYYYVNMFVDRDMFMRYLGGGVGHHALNVIADRLEIAPTDEGLEKVVDVIEPLQLPEPVELDGSIPEGPGGTGGDDLGDIEEENNADEGEDDYGYDVAGLDDDESEEEDMGGDDIAEEDLGPEDGEEGLGEVEELEDMEGFAPL
ncbi:hypothetical protein EW026_g8010 [Hermanssonia centrifuga]|uniref:Uncharacterized protein n=1 Tax=Hermanssonia centrifuga TaxID=98765 RepID=A0A4S4K6Y6_9APHY|nr:hypothetical protein EW026_g8010 [Hermanssonia centrifuga]